jgi:hypothetical protein
MYPASNYQIKEDKGEEDSQGTGRLSPIVKEFFTTKKETLHFGNVGIRGKQFRSLRFDNNLVERLHGTVRDRNKTQRGLEKEDSVFIRGHQLYYNFIRSHEGLDGKTPAEYSKINLNLGKKKWEKLLMTAVENQKINGN